MPLIDVTIRPGYTLVDLEGKPFVLCTPSYFVRQSLGPMLPAAFVNNAGLLGLASDLSAEGVQVQFHDYGPADINPADIWFMVRFGEPCPDVAVRTDICAAVYAIIEDMFAQHSFQLPANFMLDVAWGPTSGCGTMNGRRISW